MLSSSDTVALLGLFGRQEVVAADLWMTRAEHLLPNSEAY